MAQLLLFIGLVKDDSTGPLSGLEIIFWAMGTGAAILIHIIFFLFSRRKSLFGIAFLISLLFWTVAWSSHHYWQRTKHRRESIRVSDEHLELQNLVKTRVAHTLQKKNIPHEWLADSLCFKVYRDDRSFYFISTGGGFYAFERISPGLTLKDTTVWVKGLLNVFPLLTGEQLLQLGKSIRDKSFCLNVSYQGYSSAFPCWNKVVTQYYDTLSSELKTFVNYPYLLSERYEQDYMP